MQFSCGFFVVTQSEIAMVQGCEVHSASAAGRRKQAGKDCWSRLGVLSCSKAKAVTPQHGSCCYSAVLKTTSLWFSEVGNMYFVAVRYIKFGM